MRFDPQKAFEHPVLREGSSDYPDDEFSVELQIFRTIKSTELGLVAKFNLTNTELNNLVKKQKVEFTLLIQSPTTFFRNAVKSTNNELKQNFQNGELAGRVIVSPFMVAISELKDFHCPSWHEDYSQLTFEIQPGSILAVGKPYSVHIDLAEESSVASIFRLEEDSDLVNGEWRCDFDSNEKQVIIYMSEDDLFQANQVRVNPATGDPNESLLNGVYFPALVWLLQEIDRLTVANEVEDFIERQWLRSLEQKLEDMNCKKIGEGVDRLRDAQKILKYPLLMLPLQEIEQG